MNQKVTSLTSCFSSSLDSMYFHFFTRKFYCFEILFLLKKNKIIQNWNTCIIYIIIHCNTKIFNWNRKSIIHIRFIQSLRRFMCIRFSYEERITILLDIYIYFRSKFNTYFSTLLKLLCRFDLNNNTRFLRTVNFLIKISSPADNSLNPLNPVDDKVREALDFQLSIQTYRIYIYTHISIIMYLQQ